MRVYTRVYVHACARASVYARVYMCVRVCACEERDKLHFQDNSISLLCQNLFLKACGTMLSCFKCACDVEARGACDSSI